MSSWQVTEQAIAAMNNMAVQLQELTTKIHQETEQLQAAFDENQDGLGAHSSSIQALIDDVEGTEQDASVPVKKLVLKLQRSALIRQKHIENNLYSSTVSGGITASTATGFVAGTGTAAGTIKSAVNTQNVHKEFIGNYQQQVSAVIQDVKNGSGRVISEEEAKKMLYGIQSFSGTGYSKIRSAYNNPNANPKDSETLNSIDSYIRSSPKWDGTVYRGINVSKETAKEIVSKETIDMLGPSSWSSEKHVAESFSNGYKDVSIIFTLDKNKSGASITHIGSWDGAESEITAPSGIKYHIDNVKETVINGIDTIFIDVHE